MPACARRTRGLPAGPNARRGRPWTRLVRRVWKRVPAVMPSSWPQAKAERSEASRPRMARPFTASARQRQRLRVQGDTPRAFFHSPVTVLDRQHHRRYNRPQMPGSVLRRSAFHTADPSEPARRGCLATSTALDNSPRRSRQDRGRPARLRLFLFLWLFPTRVVVDRSGPVAGL